MGKDSGSNTVQNSTASTFTGTASLVSVCSAAKGEVTEQDLLAAFVDHVMSFIDVDKMKPLKVVADTANGMGGLVVPAVFEPLPVELEIMYGELDGTFPNHPPDPINPENLKALQARVLEVGADVGLAFDGDADRVFLVDDHGQRPQLEEEPLEPHVQSRERLMLGLRPGEPATALVKATSVLLER